MKRCAMCGEYINKIFFNNKGEIKMSDNKKYWCMKCDEYCMNLVNEDFSDYKVFITL